MLIYVVTRDGVVMHITTDFDKAEVTLFGWGNSVEVYEANTDDAVLELDEGIKLTLRVIGEKLGQKSYWRCSIMNGTKPKFMENQVIAPSYYEQPDPYTNASSCHVNLLELSRYAKQCGKKLIELTQEEVKNYSI